MRSTIGIRLAIVNLLMYIMPVVASAQTKSIKQQIKESVLISILEGEHWYSTDSIVLNSAVESDKNIRIRFNKTAATVLVSQDKLNAMSDSVRGWTGLKGGNITFYAEQRPLASLLPNKWKMATAKGNIVDRSIEYGEPGELAGRVYALWNSHGRYYEKNLDRWEWQRARLFTTVEDLLSSSFMLPFLAPMLENAGANVLLPRERDTQSNISIASNDGTGNIHSEVPQEGDYGVFVKYEDNHNGKVTYKVNHAGGASRYAVDQSQGYDMWIYLGTHHFTKGWSVDIEGTDDKTKEIRLGGGKGSIARYGKTSGLPTWMECARYYLESDGFDAKTVYTLSDGANDYTDDVNCRGEWVNALKNKKNIHVDASIALHTDAGFAKDDTTIGTLTIVSTNNGNGKYSDGRSKMMAFDLARTIEQQITGDIRATWDSNWSERGIWDKGYAEARRQDVPSVLVELLSHQNINDIHLALHPQFRFDACRAIYKGILRFFNGDSATVTPLPVKAFGIRQTGEETITLEWEESIDPLENSAKADIFYIYANGCFIAKTTDNKIELSQKADGKIVAYHVVAGNKGGISFPSQTLAARLISNAPKALFVDGFNRVAAPDVVDEEHFRGVLSEIEPGVAWGEDLFSTGAQYDFDPKSMWLDDDAPGCGASFADKEGGVTIGSHRNCVPQAAMELADNGYSFVSQSKEYFERDSAKHDKLYIRIWLDRQRSTWYGDMPQRHAIYSEGFLDRIEALKMCADKIYISGSYIGTDIKDAVTAKRVAEVLGFTHITNHASKTIDGVHPDGIKPAKGASTIEKYKDTDISATIRYGNVTVSGY
ncbi:MAG: N-acetylmuramoyl-L-alanine amidase [Bacteroidales bacterium]|nr:N-acetylmuramoyl-L-alanine amidase [Bacteroidales bacterium]